MKRGRASGFTIVELLIVIVVIAILAAITVIYFSNAQAKARDARRMQDLQLLAKAANLYSVENGDFANVNCGSSGSGWLTSDYDGAGPAISINDCLSQGGYLPKAVRDPSGLSSCSGLGCYAYMKGGCGASSYFYAHLETLPQTSTDLDGTCNSSYDTNYGMNYVIRVN